VKLFLSFLAIRKALTKCYNSLKIPVKKFLNKRGYSPLKALKIVDELFLFCSGHCLETPSIDVFFSSN